MATPRKTFEWNFNPQIPPMFQVPSGRLAMFNYKICQLMMLPEEFMDLRAWTNLYKAAKQELSIQLYERRLIETDNEHDQMKWLKLAGHYPWRLNPEEPQRERFMLLNAQKRVRKLDEADAAFNADRLRTQKLRDCNPAPDPSFNAVTYAADTERLLRETREGTPD